MGEKWKRKDCGDNGCAHEEWTAGEDGSDLRVVVCDLRFRWGRGLLGTAGMRRLHRKLCAARGIVCDRCHSPCSCEVELVLPSILKQNFEAVCLISVSCIGENAEVSLVVHVHEV